MSAVLIALALGFVLAALVVLDAKPWRPKPKSWTINVSFTADTTAFEAAMRQAQERLVWLRAGERVYPPSWFKSGSADDPAWPRFSIWPFRLRRGGRQ